MSSVDKIQHGGTHYKAGGPLQHWNMVPANGLGYMEACITKYVTRWRKKGGLEDLKKSLHFLDKLIEQAQAGIACPVQTHTNNTPIHGRAAQLIGLTEYADANQLNGWETIVCGLVFVWVRSGDVNKLLEARAIVAAQVDKASEPGSAYVNQ